MNSNIVKIGKALKWRGVYDNSKKYYAENIVTCYGGVFRCNVSVAQGIPPYELDEDGLPYLYNSETWTCLVDTSWIIEWVLAFQNFKKEAVARFERNEQHIDEHCRKLDEHQENIDSLNASIGSLQQKDSEHELFMSNLSDTISQVNQKADKNEDDIRAINQKIGDSELTMGELQNQIIQTNQRIDEEIGGLVDIVEEQKKKIDRLEEENEELRRQLRALQEQLESMGKYNCCFSSGVWYDDLYWHNEGLWNDGYNDEPIQTEINVVDYNKSESKLEVSGSVISYDETTGTLLVIDETNMYDDTTGTLYIDGFEGLFQDEVEVIDYEEDGGKLGVSGSVTNYNDEICELSIIDKNNSYDSKTSTLDIDGLF